MDIDSIHRRGSLFLFCLFFIPATVLLQYTRLWSQDSPELLYQKALYSQTVEGNLPEAITIYKKICDESGTIRSIAARARLQIAVCYEMKNDERAWKEYKRVIQEYPDQKEANSFARTRLSNHEKIQRSVHPLARHYLQQSFPDPTASVSPDGKYLAFTDWTSGNLAVKNIQSGIVEKLTDLVWSRSHQFASHPAWSKNGRQIAFSLHRSHTHNEHWIISRDDNQSELIQTGPNITIFPQDWNPNGNEILCEIFYDKHLKSREHSLALISISGDINVISDLSSASRGLKYSPDGKFITYDLLIEKSRHVFIYNLADAKRVQITSCSSDIVGFENPFWSPDGKLLLY